MNIDGSVIGGDKLLRVWDGPVRLFHWGLVALIATAWWTAEQRLLDWHKLTGYAILTLVLFRIVWGVVGSETARFTHFVRGVPALWTYLRRHMFDPAAHPSIGHNPIGGWSVIAMLAFLLLQTVLGLLSVDIDGLESGPFSYLVSFDAARFAAEWHAQIFNVLLGLTLLHMAAITFYFLHRGDNLVTPMVRGSRSWAGDHASLWFASPWKALAILILVTAMVSAVITQFGR